MNVYKVKVSAKKANGEAYRSGLVEASSIRAAIGKVVNRSALNPMEIRVQIMARNITLEKYKKEILNAA